MTRAPAEPTARELSADLYRVLAVLVVVLGHWLLAAVTYHDGRFGYDEVLVAIPWTRWLTWFFQVVPVFFVVAGYANAASWTRWTEHDSDGRRDWLRHRAAEALGPTTAYVLVVLAVVVISGPAGVDASLLGIPMWVVALHLWFLPVYLGVVMLTPIAVAAHRRWGLAVPAALAAGVVIIDAVSLGGHVAVLAPLNYALCWGAISQVGVAWFGGALTGRRPALLAAGAAAVLVTVVGFGFYPISMIGVPGQRIENTSPPTVALLALAGLQAGLLLAAAPTVSARLRRVRWRPLLALANQNAMALYLWHMIPVVVVAVVLYPAGLAPQPAIGSGAWWLWRAAWVGILPVVTAAQLTLLRLGRPAVGRPVPSVDIPLGPKWSEPLLVSGTLLAAIALWHFASHGFAPAGRLPIADALTFLLGVALVSLHPIGVNRLAEGATSHTPSHRPKSDARSGIRRSDSKEVHRK